MKDSTAVYRDLFLAAINANSYDVSNATFDDCVKLCITFTCIFCFAFEKFSWLVLKLTVIGHQVSVK